MGKLEQTTHLFFFMKFYRLGTGLIFGLTLGILNEEALPQVSTAQPQVIAANKSAPAPTVTPKATSPSGSAEDLILFLRAFRDFSQGNALQTTSKLSLDAKTEGATLQSVVYIKAIAQKPKQFRVDISFKSEDSSKARTYQVISDGKTVWVYRPDTQQYLVQTYEQFDKSDDSFLIGSATSLYLNSPNDFQKTVTDEALAAIAADPKMVASFYKETGTTFKGYQKDEANQNYAVYTWDDTQGASSQMNLLISPQTSTIQQFVITGKEKGMTLNLREVIVERVPNPKLTPSTFKFTPSATTKRVKSLSLSPFGE
jgi:outer membrane lipoprotein-sorting protein